MKFHTHSKKIFSIISLCSFAIFVVFAITHAINLSVFVVTSKALTTSELQDQVNTYKAQLKAIQDQKAKLALDIAKSQSLIQTDQTKIKILQDQLSSKELDIQELETQISESESSLQILQNQQSQLQTELNQTANKIDKITNIAQYQIVEAYKKIKGSENSTLVNLISSKNIANSSEFDIIVSKKDRLMIEQLSNLKYEQDQQKTALDKNKSDAEKINFSLIDQKKQLEDAKTSLLEQQNYLSKQVSVLGVQISNNNSQVSNLSTQEKQIQSQINSLEQQIFASIKTINTGVYVKKGDIIGYQGNTGNSTGEHLHFTLAINGVKVDGCKYMPSSGIKSNGSMKCNYGNGSVGLPELNGAIITQEFGNTSLGYYHDGVDMVGAKGNAILATHNGYVQRGKYSCIPGFSIPCNNGGANYVKICENKDCSKGYSSLYIHLKD